MVSTNIEERFFRAAIGMHVTPQRRENGAPEEINLWHFQNALRLQCKLF